MGGKSELSRRTLLIASIICVGITALGWAFSARKFPLLFVSAGSIWLATLVILDRLRPSVPPRAGQRRRFAGIAIVLGFLAFVPTWYLIVAFDPSLR